MAKRALEKSACPRRAAQAARHARWRRLFPRLLPFDAWRKSRVALRLVRWFTSPAVHGRKPAVASLGRWSHLNGVESLEPRCLLAAADLTVDDFVGISTNIDESFDSGTNTTTFTSTAAGAELDVTEIELELSLGRNVVVAIGDLGEGEEGNDIDILADITKTIAGDLFLVFNTEGTTATDTSTGNGDTIRVNNADITTTAGSLELRFISNDSVRFTDSTSDTGGGDFLVDADTDVSAAGATSISTDGGCLDLSAGQGVMDLDGDLSAGSGDIELVAGDELTIGMGRTISAAMGSITLRIDVGDGDAAGGTFTSDGVNYVLDPSSVLLITGEGDDDVFDISNLSLSGGAGIQIDGDSTSATNAATDTATLVNVDVSSSSGDGLSIENVAMIDISASEYTDNAGHGLVMTNVGDVTLTSVTSSRNDPGVFVSGAASFMDLDGVYELNDDGGIVLEEIAGNLTLDGTTLRDNDADDNGTGDGLLARDADGDFVAVGGDVTILEVEAHGNATATPAPQVNGIVVDRAADNVSVITVNATNVTGHEKDGFNLERGLIATVTNSTFNDNGTGSDDDGIRLFAVRRVEMENVQANDNSRRGIRIGAANGGPGLEGVVLVDVVATGNREGVRLDSPDTLNETRGVYSDNNDAGLWVNNFRNELNLTDTTANNNDADSNNNGDGIRITDTDPSGPVAFNNVTANNNNRGAFLLDIAGFSDSGGTYTGNADTGLAADDVNGNFVIDGANMDGNGVAGLSLLSVNASIQNSSFNNNTIGVLITDNGEDTLVDLGGGDNGSSLHPATSLPVSVGNNDFTSYTAMATASSGAIVNLKDNPPNDDPGPQGFPHDVPAAGNLFSTTPETVIYHDVDASGVGLVEFGGPPAVITARLFYNNSKFDGFDPTANGDDADAIATDKVSFSPGEMAAFANISSYDKGINGVILDVPDLPEDGDRGAAGPTDGLLAADDFNILVGTSSDISTWTAGPTPQVTVGPNSGPGGADRVKLIFPDDSIEDTYLAIELLANADTGLAQAMTFLFGSVVGETGQPTPPLVPFFGRDAFDFGSVAANITPLAQFGTEPITNVNDINRDGSVSAQDLTLIAAAGVNPAALPILTPVLGSPGSAAAMGVEEPTADEMGQVEEGVPTADAAGTSGTADQRVGGAKEDDRHLAFATFGDSAGSLFDEGALDLLAGDRSAL